MASKSLNAYIGLILMTLIIGLSFIFVKIGLEYANPYDLLAHRFSAAFLAVVLLKLFNAVKIPKVERKDRIAIIGLSLFYPVLFFGFQALGMQHSTASQAGIIFAFTPVLMLVVGSIALKERTSAWQKFGVAISVAGLIFIFLHKDGADSQDFSSIILLLLSVASMVGYLAVGKNLTRRYNSLSLTAIMITIGFIAFNAISFFRHLSAGDLHLFFAALVHLPFVWSVLYLGVLSSVLSSFLSNYALVYIPASQISIFTNLNPVIAILGGMLFLGEQLYWFDVIGGIAVLIGLVLVLSFKFKTV